MNKRRHFLYYQEEDGSRHLLGFSDINRSVPKPEVHRLLMDAYWDDRLDAASCNPIFMEGKGGSVSNDTRMLCTNCGRDVTGLALTAACPNCNRRGKRFAGKREMWSCLTEFAEAHVESIKKLSHIDSKSVISFPDPELKGWTNIFAARRKT